MYFYNGFSNDPSWLEEADLENTNTVVWHTFHRKYWTFEDLTKTPQWANADRIFLLGQEGDVDHFVDLDSRIHVWDSLVKPGAERFYSYFWWWWQTIDVNNAQQLTDRLTCPLQSMPKYHFDCILGEQKLHRDYIYKLLSSDQDTKNRCLTKYIYNQWLSGVDVDSIDNLKNFDIASNYSNLAGTLIPFRNQQTANIATWVPWKIYNQSWFSIVAETRYNQNFFTEKTAKPILSKKLFVYIGAAGALQDLKHLGFKTFDGIIDESYDLEPNDTKRWSNAFEQIRFLCNQQPEDIYQKALPILEHNQQLMASIDWKARSMSEMQKIVRGN
jgi:hypothetical protein